MCEMSRAEINQKLSAGNETGNVKKKVHFFFSVREKFARGARKKKKIWSKLICIYNSIAVL